jgi:hypothetical protein
MSKYIIMKLELLFIAGVAFIILNIMHNNKYIKIIYTYKKYFRIGFIIVLAILFYLMIKRNPKNCKGLLLHANNMVKFMPIDRASMDMISPIIDFTTNQNSDSTSFMSSMTGQYGGNEPGQGQGYVPGQGPGPANQRIVKRSVSETKKKYVASNQNWKCGHCGKQLNAWFEVDHKVRLDQGGSNEVQNLVALCRECHGEKTAKENM